MIPLPEPIVKALEAYERRRRLIDLARGAGEAALVGVCTVVMVGLIDVWWHPGTGLRIALSALWWTIFSATLIWRGVAPALTRRDSVDTAKAIEGRVGGAFAERLSSSLDLARNPPAGTSMWMIGRTIALAARDAVTVDTAALVPSTAVRRVLTATVVCACLVVIACLISPLRALMVRALWPFTDTARPAVHALTVKPGDMLLAQGGRFMLGVEVRPDAGRCGADLHWDDGVIEYLDLLCVAPGRYELELTTVNQGFRYQVRAGDAESIMHRVLVSPPPQLAGISLGIRPPAYTGLPSRTQAAGDAEVVAGSTVMVTASFSGTAVASASLLRDGQDTALALQLIDHGASGAVEIRAESSMSYGLQLSGVNGLVSELPQRWLLTVRADALPSARLTGEGTSDSAADVPDGKSRPVTLVGADRDFWLTMVAEDDLGLRHADLVISDDSGELTRRPLLVGSAGNEQRHLTRREHIDLREFTFVSGDHINLRLDVEDLGGQKASSLPLELAVGDADQAGAAEWAARLRGRLAEVDGQIDALRQAEKAWSSVLRSHRPDDPGAQRGDVVLLGARLAETIERIGAMADEVRSQALARQWSKSPIVMAIAEEMAVWSEVQGEIFTAMAIAARAGSADAEALTRCRDLTGSAQEELIRLRLGFGLVVGLLEGEGLVGACTAARIRGSRAAASLRGYFAWTGQDAGADPAALVAMAEASPVAAVRARLRLAEACASAALVADAISLIANDAGSENVKTSANAAGLAATACVGLDPALVTIAHLGPINQSLESLERIVCDVLEHLNQAIAARRTHPLGVIGAERGMTAEVRLRIEALKRISATPPSADREEAVRREVTAARAMAECLDTRLAQRREDLIRRAALPVATLDERADALFAREYLASEAPAAQFRLVTLLAKPLTDLNEYCAQLEAAAAELERTLHEAVKHIDSTIRVVARRQTNALRHHAGAVTHAERKGDMATADREFAEATTIVTAVSASLRKHGDAETAMAVDRALADGRLEDITRIIDEHRPPPGGPVRLDELAITLLTRVAVQLEHPEVDSTAAADLVAAAWALGLEAERRKRDASVTVRESAQAFANLAADAMIVASRPRPRQADVVDLVKRTGLVHRDDAEARGSEAAMAGRRGLGDRGVLDAAAEAVEMAASESAVPLREAVADLLARLAGDAAVTIPPNTAQREVRAERLSDLSNRDGYLDAQENAARDEFAKVQTAAAHAAIAAAGAAKNAAAAANQSATLVNACHAIAEQLPIHAAVALVCAANAGDQPVAADATEDTTSSAHLIATTRAALVKLNQVFARPFTVAALATTDAQARAQAAALGGQLADLVEAQFRAAGRLTVLLERREAIRWALAVQLAAAEAELAAMPAAPLIADTQTSAALAHSVAVLRSAARRGRARADELAISDEASSTRAGIQAAIAHQRLCAATEHLGESARAVAARLRGAVPGPAPVPTAAAQIAGAEALAAVRAAPQSPASWRHAGDLLSAAAIHAAMVDIAQGQLSVTREDPPPLPGQPREAGVVAEAAKLIPPAPLNEQAAWSRPRGELMAAGVEAFSEENQEAIRGYFKRLGSEP